MCWIFTVSICRVAVDLCSLMVPGEGLMVGSFARGLFLVHSECAESQYINSRPFRVNCGPVSKLTPLIIPWHARLEIASCIVKSSVWER